MTNPDEVDQLVAYIRSAAPQIREAPEGWPDNVELALIDAVLSIRARYGVSAHTGVRGAIARYKAESSRAGWDDLTVLADADVSWLEKTLGNRQQTGGVSKAEAIVSAAGRLAEVGAVSARDIDRNSVEQRNAYCGTRGLGSVTWQYFLMLSGHDGVKPDALVSRFVEEAIGRKADPQDVTSLVTEAAKRLKMPAGALDHSIWRHMSSPRRD